jgi:hypothetical protein
MDGNIQETNAARHLPFFRDDGMRAPTGSVDPLK